MSRQLLLAGAILASLLAATLTRVPEARAQETLEAIFQQGNEAYFRGDYAASAERYEALVELGVDDADVYYNLGTTYARQGRHGLAVAAFERALRVRAGDDGATRGLEQSRTALGRRRADREGEAMVEAGPPFGEALFGAIAPSTLAIALVVLEALFFALLFALGLVSKESLRLALGIATPLVGLLALVSGVGLAMRSGAFDEGRPAIVVRDDVSLREGPSESAGERHRASEGERAWVVGDDRGWAHVRLGGNREGWVASGDLVETGARASD